jgi:hypothetical protein
MTAVEGRPPTGPAFGRRSLGILAATSLLTTAIGTSGCTTAADARRAEGSGTRRAYRAPLADVWSAMPDIIAAAGLDLASTDRASGQIIATNGVSLFSFGENVAIFVRAAGRDETQVEVVSKAAGSTNVFANDWSDDLFDRLDARFKG